MLCQINPSVGSHADNGRSRAYNFWCSVHAIATAAAGSTPTVNPVNSSGTRNTSHNCITVLGNTEAGGWLAGTSNHYTASSTYNNNAGTIYLDLYRESGKSTYPWYRMCWWSSYNYTNGFDSYPGFQYLNGCTSSNPTTTAITSAESAFYGWPLGSNQYGNNPTAVYHNVTTTNNEHSPRVEEAGKTFLCAVTSNYIIISANDFLYYFGIRTVGGWELNRTDNPPWAHFFYTRRENYYGLSTSGSVNQNHTTKVAAWGATINAAGTQLAPQLFGQRSDISTHSCSLTGFTGWQSKTNVPGNLYQASRPIRTPLFNTELNSNWGVYGGNWNSYYYYTDSVVADTVTGLSVPPVYPVVFNLMDGNNNSAAIGTAPGIYKGMNGTAAYVNNFVTGATYTIGADTYYTVRSGRADYFDLWFIRSA
jgi:hypothetical protein